MRAAAAILAVAALAGCMAGGGDAPLGSGPGIAQGPNTDTVVAAIGRGDLANAERFAAEVVRNNPDDAYAWLALALAAEQSGRAPRAVEYYRAVLAARPAGAVVVAGAPAQPLADVARAGLERLEGRRPPPAAMAAAQTLPAVPAPGVDHVARRFEILKELLDRGLITPEEYNSRRRANIGGLLPYSEAPPAAALDWPSPTAEQFAQRLQALARALEMRSISPRDHAIERHAIIEALLPANPEMRAAPPSPPDSRQLERLQRLRGAGLVSAEEMARERDAMERVRPPAVAGGPSPQTLWEGKPPPVMVSKPSGDYAVHLASLKSEAAAKTAWQKLQKSFAKELGGLEPAVQKVDLGKKGIYWRLQGGPLGDRKAAEDICAALKKKKQFCQPVGPKG